MVPPSASPVRTVASTHSRFRTWRQGASDKLQCKQERLVMTRASGEREGTTGSVPGRAASNAET